MTWMVCFDLEGVFTPEAWLAVAEGLKIDALKKTTRDFQDYDELMRYRIDVLNQHDVRFSQMDPLIQSLPVNEGAREFLDSIRELQQAVILSDTFYEFADSFMEQLGRPTLLCHRLLIGPEGEIEGWKRRLVDPKRKAVLAFRDLGFKTVAIGDSYNDITMLQEADQGFLFRAPNRVKSDYPDLTAYDKYADLKDALLSLFDSEA